MNIVELLFRAKTAELDNAGKKLDTLTDKSKKAATAAGGIGKGFEGLKALGGPIGAVADSVDGMTSRIGEATGALGRFAGPLGLVGTAALAAAAAVVAFADRTARALDRFNDLADRTNIAADRLQYLEEKAKGADLSVEDLTSSAERLSAKLAKQDEDSGKVIKSLEALGVSTKDAAGEQKSALQVQEEVIRAVQTATDKRKAESLAVQVLGTEYYKLRAAYEDTGESQTAFYERLRDIGVLMSPENQKEVKQFNDQIKDLGRIFSGIGNSITQWVLPLMNSVLKVINDIGSKAAELAKRWLNPSAVQDQEKWIGDLEGKLATQKVAVAQLEGNAKRKTLSAMEQRQLEAAKAEQARLEEWLRDAQRHMSILKAAEQKATEDAVKGKPNEGTSTTGNPNPTTPKTPKEPKKPEFMLENGSYVDGRIARESIENRMQQTQVLYLYNQEAQKEYDALMKRVQGYRDLADPTAVYRREMEQLIRDYETGVVPLEAFTAKQLELEDAIDKAKNGPKEVAEGYNFMQRVGETAFSGLESALVSMANGGKVSFKGMVSSILQDIARMIIQLKVIKPLMDSIFGPGGAGGGGFGSIISTIGSFFGGFFAEGGNPPMGKVSVVGEKGPELIVPRSPVSVIPNSQLRSAGGGGTVQNITVAVTVNGSKDPQETANQVAQKVQEQFVRGIVKQELMSAKRTGNILNPI